MKSRLWILAALIALVASSSLPAQDRPAGDAPKIKKVVLYKHGIGYFERRGPITGNQTVTLGFKASQMKDLLTSLFAVDSRGKVEGISYDSKDPIEKQLENILIRIPSTNVLTELVGQVKGAKVEVKFGSETVRGQVVGIEPVSSKSEDGTTTVYKLVLLAEGGTLRQLNLLELASLKFLDEPLQKDLERILDIHLKSKYADRKEVKIAFAGDGSREAVIGYTIETPIWKTSYRILFEGEKPLMQGWAIVDNPTDEDWENVELTLVAGNPLSFVLDLYTPYYPSRPHLGLESFRADRDKAGPGDAQGMAARRARYAEEAEKKAKDEAWREAPAPPEAAAPRPNLTEMLARSLEPVVQGTPVGELFAYTAAAPVSVPRGKAALIPIVGQRVEGERVLSFNPLTSSKAMNAFYLKNSTALTLEAGPVTFFETSTSLGEGLLRRELKPGMREMIAYAIEAGVSVEQVVKHDSKPIHRATLANGILTVLYYQFRETEYKLHNQGDKEMTLYLDHPKRAPFALVDAKPEEELPEAWRLKVKLPAGKITSHTVRERTESSSAVYIIQTTPDQIRAYLNQPGLSAKAREFLERVAKLKGEMSELQRVRNGLATEYSQLSQDEQRYRSNISVLRDSAKERELRERYLQKLVEIDDRLGELRTKTQESDAKLRDLEASLSKMVSEFKEE